MLSNSKIFTFTFAQYLEDEAEISKNSYNKKHFTKEIYFSTTIYSLNASSWTRGTYRH